MFILLLKRELTLSFRKKADFLNPVFFFLVVCTLFPLGISPESSFLRQIAPGVIWVTSLLAILLSLDSLYREDFEDGSLLQLMLSGASATSIVFAKATANWLVTGLPLILLSPLMAMMLNLEPDAYWILMISLVLGTPTMCFIAAIGMAITVGLKKGGLLLTLLVLPLYIPILLYATMAIQAYSMGMSANGQLALLAAALLLTLALAPWAAGAALKVSMSD